MKRSITVCLLIICLGCTHGHPPDKSRAMVHVVICWLKHPGDVTDRQRIIEATKSLKNQIPGLLSVSSGAMQPSTRPVVDSTYDVGIMMYFDSPESLANYPAHPAHQKVLHEVILPLVDHYKVYDFASK
jgi:hypothetical protein